MTAIRKTLEKKKKESGASRSLLCFYAFGVLKSAKRGRLAEKNALYAAQ